MTSCTCSPGSTNFLRNALILQRPDIKDIRQLSREVHAHISAGWLHGLRLILVRWANGGSSLMFCKPRSNLPHPEKVIAGYNQCIWMNAGGPYGGSQ